MTREDVSKYFQDVVEAAFDNAGTYWQQGIEMMGAVDEAIERIAELEAQLDYERCRNEDAEAMLKSIHKAECAEQRDRWKSATECNNEMKDAIARRFGKDVFWELYKATEVE